MACRWCIRSPTPLAEDIPTHQPNTTLLINNLQGALSNLHTKMAKLESVETSQALQDSHVESVAGELQQEFLSFTPMGSQPELKTPESTRESPAGADEVIVGEGTEQERANTRAVG